MKELKILNNKECSDWMNKCLSNNHDVIAIKGDPPIGSTYSDGDPILNKINVGWKDLTTGEVFHIIYE